MRSELIGDIVGEIVRVLPDKEVELDADAFETVANTVNEVLRMAEEATDEAEDEEAEAETGV